MNRLQANDIIGSYKILNKIAEGGMAEIFKALQPSLKRTVVIKKLKDPNREIIARFKKEALLSAGFGHENLLAIYDFIYHERSYFLVMEYVDGEDLRTIVDYLAPVPHHIAALLIMEVARGLEYTHAQNIIHRDIKPSNILISYSGDVKLIDFGVAKDDTSTRLTMTGLIVGTPAYMSPEQATGDPLSPQSDIYALGILLYELLTGIKPFSGDNHTEIMAKITSSRFTPAERINPDIPYRMRHILRKSLRSDRNRRYQNATELIYDLEKCVSWQLRSRKKEVILNFLKQLDRTNELNTDDSLKAAIYIKGFSKGWRIIKYAIIMLFLYLALLLGLQFKNSELGYLKVQLPDTELRMEIDGKTRLKASSLTPVLGPLLKGEHTLKVAHPDLFGVYYSYFYIMPNDTMDLIVRLETFDDSSHVSFLSTPDSADVMLNGVQIGKTPLYKTLIPPGSHHIALHHKGCRIVERNVQLRSSESYTLNFVLTSN